MCGGQSLSAMLSNFVVKRHGQAVTDLVVAFVSTLRALQPFSKLFLSTLLTQVTEERAFLFVAAFILENRHSRFASLAGTIPHVSIFGVSSEAPDEVACWYSAHRRSPSWRKRDGDNSVKCVLPRVSLFNDR